MRYILLAASSPLRTEIALRVRFRRIISYCLARTNLAAKLLLYVPNSQLIETKPTMIFPDAANKFFRSKNFNFHADILRFSNV